MHYTFREATLSEVDFTKCRWVCHPIRNIDEICARLDAVDDFAANIHKKETAMSTLRKFPDLERIISRIHGGNCLVKDFVAALKCFSSVNDLFQEFDGLHFKSSFLRNLFAQSVPAGLERILEEFKESFDYEDAIKTGKIALNEGHDEGYDELCHCVVVKEKKLQSYRQECEKAISCRITYKDIGKEVYQLEVSSKTKTPKNWVVMSKTKEVTRYYTPELRNLVHELSLAQERCEMAKRNIKLVLYQKFDEYYDQWMTIIQNLAHLDCIMNLHTCSTNLAGFNILT